LKTHISSCNTCNSTFTEQIQCPCCKSFGFTVNESPDRTEANAELNLLFTKAMLNKQLSIQLFERGLFTSLMSPGLMSFVSDTPNKKILEIETLIVADMQTTRLDRGFINVRGTKICWFMQCVDKQMNNAAEDSLNTDLCHRVLVIHLPDEDE
jgi:hypothetical protein